MGTRRGDNEWRIDQNRQVAIGTDSNGMTFLVDVDDLPLVRNYTWIVDKRDGYVRSKITINGKRKTLLMHRIVMDTPIDKLTDHINHQKTDNRRSNL